VHALLAWFIIYQALFYHQWHYESKDQNRTFIFQSRELIILCSAQKVAQRRI
jgi:hypothetical protein